MTKRKHKRTPRFVAIRLLNDGTAELVDDEGEIFHVQMMRGEAWPILSRQVRRFEMNEKHPREPDALSPPPFTTPPGTLKVIK